MRSHPMISRTASPYRQTISMPRAQRGIALVVALIFLVLLTILALTATSNSLLQERMAGALRNSQQAEMSAETALRGAEWRMWSRTTQIGGHPDCLGDAISADDGCAKYDLGSPLYQPGGAVTQFRTAQNWIPGIGFTYKGADGGTDYTSGALGTAQLADNPQYLIEDLGRELPPGAGPQHESGDTGPNNNGPGQINTHIYRITARATGGNENTVRVLQSTFDAQASN